MLNWQERYIGEALTFDDVLLIPQKSEILPKDINVSTLLTNNIELHIPLVSAAMDTVTESQTAITMAREGGIGIIHKNMSIDEHALEVEKVKKSESGMVVNPITVDPEQKIHDALKIMKQYQISGFPVVKAGKLVGILCGEVLSRSGHHGLLDIDKQGFLVDISIAGDGIDNSQHFIIHVCIPIQLSQAVAWPYLVVRYPSSFLRGMRAKKQGHAVDQNAAWPTSAARPGRASRS